MKKAILLLLGVLVLGGAQIVLTLAPTAVIDVEGYSPQEIHDLGLDTEPSTGLRVVGVGELVYLAGRNAGGEEVTGYAWSLQAPTGSAAVLDATDTERVTFRPDVPGKFIVNLTVNTTAGAADASVTITAAEYVSVGMVGNEIFPSIQQGECAVCHSEHFVRWNRTGHADFFARAIDGLASSHYGENCIECHVVGFNENPAADNMGFDDVARQLGWEFPDELKPGNWADMVENYPELAQRASIQCENCHGPGSLHRGDKSGTQVSLEEEVCGRCHEEAPYHQISTQWKNSSHATGASFARGTSGSCARCHSGHGFIAYIDPLSNLDQKTSTTPVTCAVCHDPHPSEEVAGAEVHQLRAVQNVLLQNGVTVTRGGFGKHCMNCHQSRRDAGAYVQENFDAKSYRHFGPHYSNQADMLFGTNAIHFGRILPNSTHYAAVDNSCVGCHMAPGPGTGEPGNLELGGHSWSMHSENGGDFVEACVRCHGPMESFDDLKAREDHDGDGVIEAAQDEVHGLLDAVGMLLPPYGSPEVDIESNPAEVSLIEAKAAFNYEFVYEDGSEGMHNFQYVVSLLKLTKEVLENGILAESTIDDIVDVPNDQGKQVLVKWGRFGGDGPSDDPVLTYFVWRKVDASMGISKNATVYESINDVPADASASAGSVVQFGDGLWTQVGGQAAAERQAYAAVVPTLYDSTGAGINWSTFVVSGHTATGAYAVTDPDSAYSVDNLVPAAPSGATAAVDGRSVVLTWDEPVDADFDYFEVYRSDDPNFDFQWAPPVASTTDPTWRDVYVDRVRTYYYRIAAFDFSGNRSEFSGQIQAFVPTDVESTGGVPTTFALGQNYPNPFNPSTQVSFDVPTTEHVRVAVYDLSGREVAVLVDRTMAPGRYQVNWDAGRGAASGVYFCRMETPSYAFVRTMTLLK